MIAMTMATANIQLQAIVSTDYDFDFNEDINNAYNLVTALRLDEARNALHQLKQTQPNNLAPIFIEDYIDFLCLMLSEDKALLRNYQINFNNRLALIDKNCFKHSPYYLFIKSEMTMHRAAVDFRFGNNILAFTAALKAYKLLETNRTLFPDFVPNLKNLGLMQIIVGSMPPSFKGGFSFFTGISGSVVIGSQDVKRVMNEKSRQSYIFAFEAKVLYSFIQLYINDEPDEAWALLRQTKVNYHAQPLLAFIHAGASYRSKRNDECIRLLTENNYGTDYYPITISNLILGRAKLNRMDKDANIFLERFLKQYKGTTFRKEAHLLLHWYYTLFPDQKKREQHYQAVFSDGNTNADSDNAAMQELKANHVNSQVFLRARLLYDGGYSQRALTELILAKSGIKNNPSLLLEYNYRYARILQQMNNIQDAIRLYRQVITTGRSHSEYFACNAALQIAVIYEKTNQPANSEFYYNECLRINPATYKNSLHGKAKAGLLRLKQK